MGKKDQKGSDDKSKERRKQTEIVAKHLRFTVPTKKAKLKRENVEYICGSKAVDCLLESKWATLEEESNTEFIPYMATRAIAVDFCQRLIDMGYCLRVMKIEVKGKEENEEETTKKGAGKKKKETAIRQPKDNDQDDDDNGKKKKKKFRLKQHDHPKFIDSNDDFYIWIYNPPSKWSYILGVLVLVGAVAATLYPLWPQSSQIGIYYGSWALLMVVLLLLGLFVVRLLLFLLVWCATMGRTHFWLFPNLNEDLGVWESFKPLYSIKNKGGTKKSKNKHKETAEDNDTQQEDKAVEATNEDQTNTTGDT